MGAGTVQLMEAQKEQIRQTVNEIAPQCYIHLDDVEDDAD